MIAFLLVSLYAGGSSATSATPIRLFGYDSNPAGETAFASTPEAACTSSFRMNHYLDENNTTISNPIGYCNATGSAYNLEVRKTASFAGVDLRPMKIVCLIDYTETFFMHRPEECGGPSSWNNEAQQEAPDIVSLHLACPPGYVLFGGNECRSGDTPVPEKDACKIGNPVQPGSGCKEESVALATISSAGGQFGLAATYANLTQFRDMGGRSLGDSSWFLDPFDRSLKLDEVGSGKIGVRRPGGGAETYVESPPGTWLGPEKQIRLSSLGTGWRRIDFDRREFEDYDSQGRLASKKSFTGHGLEIAYSASTGRPERLTLSGGRAIALNSDGTKVQSIELAPGSSVGFSYTTPAAQLPELNTPVLQTVTFPDGGALTYAYEATFGAPGATGLAGLLSTTAVLWDGGAGSGATLAAQIATVKSGRSSYNLIGTKDESGSSLGTYMYDSKGRVIQSTRSGGAYSHTFTYNTYDTAVTTPLGGTETFNFEMSSGLKRLASVVSKDPGGAVLRMHYVVRDPDGHVRETGDGSYRACMSYHAATQRLSAVVQGLPSWGACESTDWNAYAPTGNQRKTSHEWTSALRLEKRRAEPGLITTWVYNGEADPTAGGATASCAPGSALLPGGTPIAVLCKKVEQATTDANGGAGFGATAAGAARIWAWTYNADGQVLTENGPRTDVSDTTTWEYYTATDTATPKKWFKGDLKKVTNAAGHVTEYTKYDGYGQVLGMTEPGGAVWTFTYSPRQWLTGASVTKSGLTQSTTIEYWPTGKVKKVTQPDASFLSYAYDAAQRLTSVTDNAGNSVTYTLDAAGNRTVEDWKDAGATLRLKISRTMDALSRVTQITGAAGALPLMNPGVGPIGTPMAGGATHEQP